MLLLLSNYILKMYRRHSRQRQGRGRASPDLGYLESHWQRDPLLRYKWEKLR
jgi:hypothetical protein